MRHFRSLHLAVSALAALSMTGADRAAADNGKSGVQISVNEAARRVDVTVDGQPFTSYVWPERLKKPVLYPIRTASGTVITRGYPLDPRPGERVDHPHHVGLWLNHGDVNGLESALLRRPGLFVGTITEKLMTYALGRGVDYYDAPAVRTIVRQARAQNFRISSIILGVVKSRSFQMRKSR